MPGLILPSNTGQRVIRVLEQLKAVRILIKGAMYDVATGKVCFLD